MQDEITELSSMPEENVTIDNNSNTSDNATITAGQSSAVAASNTGAEDTAGKAYEDIINAKDGIISAYEKQVSTLQEQINRLIRGGGVITDDNAQQTQQAQNTSSHPFESPSDAYRRNYKTFADLGKEIGDTRH